MPQNGDRHKMPIMCQGTKLANSFKALSSKIRRGFVVDSVSIARGRLRYSVALVMVVSMMIGSFRAVRVEETERTHWLLPLRGSGLATNGSVREGFGEALQSEVFVPLGREAFLLLV
jgi:hypothetical protein